MPYYEMSVHCAVMNPDAVEKIQSLHYLRSGLDFQLNWRVHIGLPNKLRFYLLGLTNDILWS